MFIHTDTFAITSIEIGATFSSEKEKKYRSNLIIKPYFRKKNIVKRLSLHVLYLMIYFRFLRRNQCN